MKTSSLALLEKTQLPPAQARAILEIMDNEFAEHARSFVSPADLVATKTEILDAFADLSRTVIEMGQRLTEMGHRLTETGHQTDNRITELGHRLELESKSVRSDLTAAIAGVEVKLAGAEARLTRWVFTCILGQSAIFASALYFAFTHSR